MILKTTSEVIRLVTSTAAPIDVQVNYADHTSSSFTPSSQNTKISSATTTDIVSAPAASTQRQIKSIMLHNTSTTTANNLQINVFDGTDTFKVFNLSLSPDEHNHYDGQGWVKYSPNGLPINTSPIPQDLIGMIKTLFKIGTATEAAGVFYCFAKDSGFPGAWAVGTPGLAGRVTNGTTVGDVGSLNYGNPASGSWYLRDMNITTTVAGFVQLLDFLWVNSGIVVTTTTAQTINSVTLPSRDVNGTTDGKGIEVGILITTATTNSGAITNMTLSYTNSENVGGRTATISSFPATAVIGTFVKFQLAAGDKGVRSIQSVTLGTSLVAGSVSLVLFNTVLSSSCILANAGNLAYPRTTDVKLHDGHALIPVVQTGAASAVTLNGNIYAINK